MTATKQHNYAFIEKLERSQTKKTSMGLQDAHSKVTRHGDALNITKINKKSNVSSKKPAHAVGRDLRQNRKVSRSERSVETLGQPRNGDTPLSVAKKHKKSNGDGAK